MRKKYSDEQIPEGPRQHPGLSASQRQKQKLGPKKCIICGSVLGTWGKYCPNCRPPHIKELMKYEQEQRLASALSEIDSASPRLRLPEVVKKTAAAIYKKAVEEKLSRGRSVRCMAATALYAACREHAVPQTMDDIAEAAQVTKKEIARSYKAIARGLLLRPQPTGPVDYAPRICSTLKLSDATRAKAIQLLEEATKKRLTSGRGPTGVAAAAIYIAGMTTGEKRTQREVAAAARVTEVTLRNRFHETCEKLNLPYTKQTRRER
jgi:transcription initiation factor TFIIB